MARRKLTAAEKLRNKAAAINRKAAEALPLFAAILPQVTARDVYWRSRRNWARAAEHVSTLRGTQLLTTLTMHKLRRLAQAALPAADFEALDHYSRETYPPDHLLGFWMDLLAGRKSVVYRWKRIPTDTTSVGFRCIPDGEFPPPGWTPPYSWEQVLELAAIDRFDQKPDEFGATCHP